MSFQGFITNGETFVYQVGTLNTSAAFGLDENDYGRWKLAVSSSPGAQPSGTAQIAVDNTNPGYIELTPNGPGGQVYVNDADVNAYGADVSTSANGFNCIKSRNYLVLDAGDTLGYFTFGGFDGTNDIQSAQIISVNPSGSTIATGQIAGDMSFYTAPNNTNGPTLRAYMPITGGLEIKTPDSGNALKVDPFGVGVLLSSSSGVISSLTPGVSNYVLVSNGVSSAPTWQAVPATAGVTAIAGTASEITASASTGSVTLSTPSTFIAPGSIASTTSLTAGSGFTVTAGTTTITPLNAAGMVINSAAGVITTAATTQHAVQIGSSGGQLSSLTVGTNGQVLVGSTTADPVFATLTSSSLSYTTGAGSLAINISAPVSIANGGTNATSMATTDGVCYFDGTRIVTTSAGTSTYVLTSNGAGNAPTFQAAAGGGVTSLAGTSNEITASASTGAVTLSVPSTFIAPGSIEATSTVKADTNFLLPTTSSTAGQLQINGTVVLQSYGTSNIFIGTATSTAGNFTLTTGSASQNVGIGGGALVALTTAKHNTCVGYGAGNAKTSGDANTFIGWEAGLNVTTGASNVAIGVQCLSDNTCTGSSNQAIGNGCLYSMTSGGNNVSYGANSGTNLTTGSNNLIMGCQPDVTGGSGNASYPAGEYTSSESNNVCIQNIGVTGESNVMRIGTSGSGTCEVNKCFIAGIYGVAEGGTENLVTINSNGQLGSGTATSVTGSLSMSTTITAGTGLTISAGGAVFTTTGTNGITSIDTYGRTVGATTAAVLIDSTGLFGTIISARKYKENIQDMASASDAIYNLRPVTYNLKSDDQKTIQYGLIAEEVVDVMPRLVGYKDGEINTVHYHELPALLLNEMQKMQKTIHAMAARIAVLEMKGN